MNVVWAHHERLSRSFEWRRHSAPPTECRQREKPSGKRSWRDQTTFSKRNSRKRYWAADGKVADASKARKQAARDEEREAQAVHGLAAMQQGGNQ